jgi:hypothetical protein
LRNHSIKIEMVQWEERVARLSGALVAARPMGGEGGATEREQREEREAAGAGAGETARGADRGDGTQRLWGREKKKLALYHIGITETLTLH